MLCKGISTRWQSNRQKGIAHYDNVRNVNPHKELK